MKLKKLTYTQLKKLRKLQWRKQGKKCAVLGKKIPYENATMDHKHVKKGDELGKEGAGLLRGVLDFRVNAFEGKVANLYVRLGLHKLIELPILLRNLASFLEDPPIDQIYIHPSEREFKIIKKSEYNKLKKRYFKKYPKRRRFPNYPKKGKLTKTLEKIMKDLNGSNNR